MSIGQASASKLCRELAKGWSAEHPEAPRRFFAHLRAHWQVDIQNETPGCSAYQADLRQDQLHLSAMSTFRCLVLGHGADLGHELIHVTRNHAGAGRIILVILAMPTKFKNIAWQFTRPNWCVLLDIRELEDLLGCKQPFRRLKEHCRRNIPAMHLLHWGSNHPAPESMFFGRRNILRRLHYEETKSFAIVGPRRIGKSSLLHKYCHEIRINNRDDRRHRLFFINCEPGAVWNQDQFARKLAFAISPDSKANRINTRTLLGFLKRHSSKGQRPLELLLDDVDDVCLNKSFAPLAEAVRANYCRLILSGRGNLYRMMKDGAQQLANCLELIRLEPLDPKSARQLIFRPLGDVGVVIDNKEALQQSVFELSGRLPHLIQDCLGIVLRHWQKELPLAITSQDLKRLRENFTTMPNSLLDREHLRDDLSLLMALLWLRHGKRRVTTGSLQRIARKHGILLSAAKAEAICDDLWFHNVFSWERGVMSVAVPQMFECVRSMLNFNDVISHLKGLVDSSEVNKNLER